MHWSPQPTQRLSYAPRTSSMALGLTDDTGYTQPSLTTLVYPTTIVRKALTIVRPTCVQDALAPCILDARWTGRAKSSTTKLKRSRLILVDRYHL